MEVPEPRVFKRTEWVRVLKANDTWALAAPRHRLQRGHRCGLRLRDAHVLCEVLGHFRAGADHDHGVRGGLHMPGQHRGCLAAAVQQQSGKGDQGALAKERGVAHRAVRAAEQTTEVGHGKVHKALCFFNWPKTLTVL